MKIDTITMTVAEIFAGKTPSYKEIREYGAKLVETYDSFTYVFRDGSQGVFKKDDGTPVFYGEGYGYLFSVTNLDLTGFRIP